MDRIVIPTSAGVGSAVGFLRAPVAYEVVRSRFFRLGGFDSAAVNAMLREMQDEARQIVATGAPGAAIGEHRHVEMRYIGQGHEIAVDLPLRDLTTDDAPFLRDLFEKRYAEIFGRAVPGVEVEILAWSITMSASVSRQDQRSADAGRRILPRTTGAGCSTGCWANTRMWPSIGATSWRRAAASPAPPSSPKSQTATVVSAAFDARIDRFGHIVLERRP